MISIVKFSMLLIITLIILIPLGNFIIRKILEKIFYKENKKCCSTCEEVLKKEHEDKTGRIIGTFERLLYFIGIYFNNWTLITIVVAIKSIARYSKLDDKEFAEKFLIGTLISLSFAIIIGYLFIAINNYFEIDNSIKDLFKNIIDIKIVESKPSE